MSYQEFQAKINGLIERAGGKIGVRFFESDNGRFFAKCSDGTTIIGSARNLKVTVRWGGKNHQAVVAI